MPEFLKKMFISKISKISNSEKYLSYDGLAHLIVNIKNVKVTVNETLTMYYPKKGEQPNITFTKNGIASIIDVYLNGMRLFENTDYTINGNTIIFNFTIDSEENTISVSVRNIEIKWS